MACPGGTAGGRAWRVSCRPSVLLACLAALGCGWKVGDPVGPGAVRGTVVVMQTQDGEVLGSKFTEPGSTVTLTVADAGSANGLSPKYIAVRTEPRNGKIGSRVAHSDTGRVSFSPPSDGSPVRAAFMSTESLPEAVMDCYYEKFWGPGFVQVARALPGERVDSDASVTVLDGDETVFTEVIDDVNAASVDRHGVVLARLAWAPNGADVRIKAGFSDPPAIAFFWLGGFDAGRYVLVNPRDSRRDQALAALDGLLCGDSCGRTACGESMAPYLVDPAGSGYRLSRQGVSLVRFGAWLSYDANF